MALSMQALAPRLEEFAQQRRGGPLGDAAIDLRPMWELGAFELRGFSKMQRLFELPPDQGQT